MKTFPTSGSGQGQSDAASISLRSPSKAERWGGRRMKRFADFGVHTNEIKNKNLLVSLFSGLLKNWITDTLAAGFFQSKRGPKYFLARIVLSFWQGFRKS